MGQKKENDKYPKMRAYAGDMLSAIEEIQAEVLEKGEIGKQPEGFQKAVAALEKIKK